ncbi:histidine triad nucleotide-binding protein [Nisaea sp.]|uniref:histidine triad nucleotide-binding protein n=1 Tax=Nisaea sp. TaxID=2024842 RepID=UPI003B52A043
MAYDDQNIFARILRGEIPNRTVYEDEHVLAFEDIQPQAPVHVLVIPKGPYRSMNEFSAEASDEEIVAWVRAIGKVAEIVDAKGPGYRLIVNNGDNAIQEVPHLHIHVLGGRRLGRMLPKGD